MTKKSKKRRQKTKRAAHRGEAGKRQCFLPRTGEFDSLISDLDDGLCA